MCCFCRLSVQLARVCLQITHTVSSPVYGESLYLLYEIVLWRNGSVQADWGSACSKSFFHGVRKVYSCDFKKTARFLPLSVPYMQRQCRPLYFGSHLLLAAAITLMSTMRMTSPPTAAITYLILSLTVLMSMSLKLSSSS